MDAADLKKSILNYTRKINRLSSMLDCANNKLKTVSDRIPKYNIQSYFVDELTQDQFEYLKSFQHDIVQTYERDMIDVYFEWDSESYQKRFDEDSAAIQIHIQYQTEELNRYVQFKEECERELREHKEARIQYYKQLYAK